MATKTATPTAAGQQIVAWVVGHVEYYLERQSGAGRTPDEVTEERTAIIAGIVAALRRPA